MDVPNIIKGRVVPSTVEFYGETFHREANLDEWFGKLCAIQDAAENVLIAYGMGWDLDGVMDRLKTAIESADR